MTSTHEIWVWKVPETRPTTKPISSSDAEVTAKGAKQSVEISQDSEVVNVKNRDTLQAPRACEVEVDAFEQDLQRQIRITNIHYP